MTTTESFADQVNNFDFYFEMSDSTKTYYKGVSAQSEIKQIAESMTANELIEAKKLITVEQELIDRYFQGLFPEVSPEPQPSANSELFKMAWSIVKSGLAESFSIALKKAWIIMRIKLQGEVTISFAKETGELRNALAISVGKLDTVEKGFVRYMENIEGVETWRSFRIERLLTA
ncbi:MAG TPA: hypothetical protein PLY70_00675 [Saprospiraceae bacterium]|nr:hypothetical protein [Saprospiraceae bacterium]HPN68149.1 hypothetical protein [Saprospiraceae bacterium]